MTGMGAPSYNRAPSRALLRLLAANAPLARLLRPRTASGIEIEIQFRGGSEIHLCCGLTCILKCRRKGGNSIRVETGRKHACRPGANGLFRPGSRCVSNGGAYVGDVWSVGDPAFARAVETFLDEVTVGERQAKEGLIQARWSRVTAPWTVFDKEAQLAYPSKPARERRLSEAFRPSVEAARSQVHALGLRRNWARLSAAKTRLKVDALAVDPEGNLVLLEVKDASGSASEVYYAPFQLLQNVWEWQRALPAVRRSLQELLDARMELVLTPSGVAQVTGGIRAAVGFGADHRSEEVKFRHSEVLNAANAHLPPGVPPIETWALANGQPTRLE
ncbi:MAG: hypothetical protein F4Z55_02170 [Boseongicola sp. SB0667_bin_21]|nr:hypothetical protein [Boseongicola sp. SB0667_bin_21]